jgi:hypothetical protein
MDSHIDVTPIQVPAQPQTSVQKPIQKKRRVYVDPEVMSKYIEEISLSMGQRYLSFLHRI